MPPGDLGIEPAGRRIVFRPADLRLDDALEPVQRGTRAKAFEWIAPAKLIAQADRIVVTIRVAKAEQQAACAFQAEGGDQFLAQQAERRRAEDHDPLFVQADHALVWEKFEHFRQVQIARGGHGS